MISEASRYRLAAKARLRFDRKTERYMLLYPEKGLVLNPTAADVLQLCTGEHTVKAIVDQLAQKYGHQPPAVEHEIVAFLSMMVDRGLVQEAS